MHPTPSGQRPIETETVPARGAPSAASRLSGWLREPMLHFVVMGALLFALDHWLVGQADDPRTIVVGADVVAEARAVFRGERGREPNGEELNALTRRWIDNEILYREGLALKVNDGDDMIRERVIFKSLMLVESGLKLPPADDRTLVTWFEGQRARYDEPTRLDFQEAVLSGDTSESAAAAFAQTLNSGSPGDAKAGLRVFKARPLPTIVQSYGAGFASALAEASPGVWRALPTSDGVRVVRLDAVMPARPASFEQLRNVVRSDWIDATKSQMRTDAVRARGEKYTVRIEGAAS